MKTWSVELDANSWNDDTFNGTFRECINYCKDHGYNLDGIDARLAEVEVNEVGTVTFCHDIYTE